MNHIKTVTHSQNPMVGTCGHCYCTTCIQQASATYMDGLFEDNDGTNLYAAEDTIGLLEAINELSNTTRQLVMCPQVGRRAAASCELRSRHAPLGLRLIVLCTREHSVLYLPPSNPVLE